MGSIAEADEEAEVGEYDAQVDLFPALLQIGHS